MAEPTVIERMDRIYRDQFDEWIQIAPGDEAGRQSMLAAVRELRDALKKRHGWVSCEIIQVIDECENSQVSKSDKPLSHTNPPSE